LKWGGLSLIRVLMASHALLFKKIFCALGFESITVESQKPKYRTELCKIGIDYTV